MINNDWKKIKTGIGFADHIPEAICGLSSEDRIVRESSYWKIDNYVIIQSDLYEAAYYTIDLILELLQQSYTVNRYYPLSLLIEIAFGYSPESIYIDNQKKSINLTVACQEKLNTNLSIIKAFEVKDQDEIDEKSALIEKIESWGS